MDPTIVAIGIGFAAQLAIISYSYGKINQKVEDVDTRLERVENKLNGYTSYDGKERRK